MNARQKAKNLKKKINILKLDNNLMRRIIVDNPTMKELYDAYNKPVFVTHSTMEFQEYKARRYLPPDIPCDDIAAVLTALMPGLTDDLLGAVKRNILYTLDTECAIPTITASIFIGRK